MSVFKLSLINHMGQKWSTQSVGNLGKYKLYAGDIVVFSSLWDNGQENPFLKVGYHQIGHTFMVIHSEQMPMLRNIHQYLTIGECNHHGCLMNKPVRLENGQKPIEIFHFIGHPQIPTGVYQTQIRQIADNYDDKTRIEYPKIAELAQIYMKGSLKYNNKLQCKPFRLRSKFETLDIAFSKGKVVFTTELRNIMGRVVCSEFNAFIAQYALWRSVTYLEQKHVQPMKAMSIVFEILPFANGAWPEDFSQMPEKYWTNIQLYVKTDYDLKPLPKIKF